MTPAALAALVRDALTQAGLWRSGAGLLVGVSGGADSVALLVALHRLRGEGGFRLEACHVQHGLRGESALSDERFVRDLCCTLGVPLHVENARLGDPHAPGVETRARDSRRRIFEALMRERGMDALLLAHHRGDQAETVLLRLLRGAGAEGLRGMRPIMPFGAGVLLRPFLDVPKAELADALSAEGLDHCEDLTNAQPITLRNVLRLSVLPVLEAAAPGAEAHMAQAAESLAADEAYLAAEAGALYRRARCDAPTPALWLHALADAPAPLLRRVVRQWYVDALLLRDGALPQERALDYRDTLALAALALGEAVQAHNLPGGLKAVRGRRQIFLCRPDGAPLCDLPPVQPQPLCGDWREWRAGSLCIVRAPIAPGASIPPTPREVLLPPQVLQSQPVLRMPQPHDRIRPLGAPGHKPLRRYLCDRGVDALWRTHIPVLAVQGEVLWAPGLCISQALRLDAAPADGVRLTLQSDPGYLPPRTTKE